MSYDWRALIREAIKQPKHPGPHHSQAHRKLRMVVDETHLISKKTLEKVLRELEPIFNGASEIEIERDEE